MIDFYNNKRVLVTGGTGFVGRHLVEKLISRGSEVFVTGNSKNVWVGSLDHRKLHYSNLDISNYQDIERLVINSKPQVIFHLAAIVTASRDFSLVDEMIDVNLKGTTNLLKAIGKITSLESMVNFGSSEEYGNQQIELSEILREEPASPYAILKMTTTRFCNMFSEIYKIPITTIRPANIFGPYQPSEKFIPYSIIKCLKGENINMTFGEQERNFIYVEDFIGATLLIGEKERKLAQIYNVGSESYITLKEIVQQIKTLTNSSSDIGYGTVNYRDGEMMKFDINIEKLKELGWDTRDNFKKNLNSTIKFYDDYMEG
jgi:UDP-glucose 4-epimerase